MVSDGASAARSRMKEPLRMVPLEARGDEILRRREAAVRWSRGVAFAARIDSQTIALLGRLRHAEPLAPPPHRHCSGPPHRRAGRDDRRPRHGRVRRVRERGRITYVFDGDTFRLDSGTRIRIAAIDSAETRYPQAKCAREIASARPRRRGSEPCSTAEGWAIRWSAGTGTGWSPRSGSGTAISADC